MFGIRPEALDVHELFFCPFPVASNLSLFKIQYINKAFNEDGTPNIHTDFKGQFGYSEIITNAGNLANISSPMDELSQYSSLAGSLLWVFVAAAPRIYGQLHGLKNHGK